METIKKPWWTYIAVTLPQCALILLYLSAYGVIGPLMEPDNITAWGWAGLVAGLPLAGFTLHAVFTQARGRTVGAVAGGLMVAVYTAIMLLFLKFDTDLVPFGIPSWMFSPEDLFIAPFSLSMPGVLYGMLLLVERFRPVEGQKRTVVIEALVAVLVPLGWYLLITSILPVLRGGLGSGMFMEHLMTILMVTSSLILLFVIIRLSWRIASRNVPRAWLLRLPFALLLPLTCFVVYNAFFSTGWGFLGDLSHPGYYIVTLICGLLITVPAPKGPGLRLLVLATKGVCWPFVLYFFLALLPFIPFGLFLVVFIGTGILIFGPLVLMVLLTRSMAQDFRELGGHYSRRALAGALLASALVIPLWVTALFLGDRAELDRALTHVYEPDYMASQTDGFDPASLKRVLGHVESSKRGEGWRARDDKPYITSFYSWLVLDNLTLSDKRLRDLEMLFMGSSGERRQLMVMPAEAGPGPGIERISASTAPSQEGGYYLSRVDMDIRRGEGQGTEFAASFALPPGAWVSGYYLMIDGQRVEGLLTDKRAATWIYRQIVGQRRDPGIMHYIGGGRVALRVFPFSEGQTRTTGFELIHRGPVSLDIAGREVRLGAPISHDSPMHSGGYRLVTPALKAGLKKATRRPYYHFIVDMSGAGANKTDNFARRVGSVIDSDALGLGPGPEPRLSAANYMVRDITMRPGWQEELKAMPSRGGFNLEHALKRAMLENYFRADGTQPVFVVVTDALELAVFASGMEGFGAVYPEGGPFFVAELEGGLRAYRSLEDPGSAFDPGRYEPPATLLLPSGDKPVSHVSTRPEPEILLGRDRAESEAGPDRWQEGLELYGRWVETVLYPRAQAAKRHEIVRGSLGAGLMTPYTSFISLENEAQREALIRKQKEILSTDRPRDIAEESRMSEPPLAVMFAALALLYAVSRGLRRRGRAM